MEGGPRSTNLSRTHLVGLIESQVASLPLDCVGRLHDWNPHSVSRSRGGMFGPLSWAKDIVGHVAPKDRDRVLADALEALVKPATVILIDRESRN